MKNLKNSSKLISVITVLAIAGLSGYYFFQPEFKSDDDLYKIASVTDGDTVRLADGQRVRLLGVDAPEKGKCGYDEAKDFLVNLIEKKDVQLVKDIKNIDIYGRLLRYVILPVENGDDRLINNELLEQGYAENYSEAPNNRYRDLFISAQEEAKKKRLGIWGDCLGTEEKVKLEKSDRPPPNKDCIIKGNISEKSFGRTYLVPGCDNYNNVKIDYGKGEQYFCSEKEAINAGFRKATNCP